MLERESRRCAMFPIVRCICASVTCLTAALAALQGQNPIHSERLEVSHNKPFVMVMVNGKGPFRFVIDTGTGGDAFVTPEFAEALGLSAVGQARLSDPSKQCIRSVPVVMMQSLEVAGVEFRDIKARVHALGKGEGSYEGLLGFSLFRDYLLTLDYPNRELTLATGSLVPDGEHSVLSFRIPDGIPIV